MNFDPTITTAELLTTVIALIGFVGGYFTFKTNFINYTKRQDEIDRKVHSIDVELAAFKLHSAEVFVRRDDIEKLEERISKMFTTMMDGIGRRMETVEHQLRNIDTKILSIVNLRGKERE